MDLSIIFPVRNLQDELSGILSHVQRQMGNLSSELIVVDMDSQDATVVNALNLLHEANISGYVIQNGAGTPAAALNSGIQRARGKYISFLFARRLYDNILEGYVSTAEHTDADVVFGSVTESDSRSAERQSMSRVVKTRPGNSYIQDYLEEKLPLDIAAVLIRRQFLLENQLWFSGECRYGYAREFLLCCLMRAEKVVQSPVLMVRSPEYEVTRSFQDITAREVFQEIESALRVRDIAWCEHGQDTELLDRIDSCLIPSAIMHCVDVLLREGILSTVIRRELKKNGYQKLLKVGKYTPPVLKKKISHWKSPLHSYEAE